MIKTIFASFIFCTVLMACASTPDQAVDWKNGAKRGWIVSVYAPGISNDEFPECISRLPKEVFASKHFVKVQYRQVRQMYYAIAEMPEALKAHIDDQVEVWPQDCVNGKFSSISRIIFSAAP